ncbi:Receptor-type tyrosine-protein phosphatase alpha [Geodia barretti]|uniref:protein-tyrosine-phosphatase n=1 Tax=Geodia barretti TaxID=519541 RepID=A0AA35S9L2_GEOBA|nr:Receptor-type tyrosine-protein phosphatase alpha [Geodia barretti]
MNLGSLGQTGGNPAPSGEGNVGNDDSGGGGNTGVIVAGVLVPIILIAVAAVLLLVVFLVWRRRRGSKDPRYSRSSPARPPPPSTKKTPPPVASSNALPPPVQYSKSEESVQYRHNSSHRANGKAPVIVDFPDDAQYVQEGEGVMFRVGVTGVPHPKLTWYHDGVEVVPDYSRELAEDGTLSMPSAETNHSGVYQLVAHNPGGRAEREVRLTVAAEGETPPVSGRPPVTLAPVLVTKLADHVEKNHSRGNKGFSDEYQSLYDGEGKTIAIATNSENRLKNRFGNICVYDDHRVILKPLPGHRDCQSDYINASYVGGFSKAGRFLSTQGLSQERSPSIVMITNLEEGGKIKCQRYWPETGRCGFGPFTVTLTDEQIFADYTIRKLELQLDSERPLKVIQFHFTAWPDHGVPDYATPILAFHRRVMKEHRAKKGPLMVHCSAGVGRTGTFITIDHVLEQLGKENVVDIPGVINKIRHQRMKLVQTVDQYVFIHDAVLESVTCGDTQIEASSLRVAMRKLKEKSLQGGSPLQQQFSILEKVSPNPREVKAVAAHSNSKKNRSMEFPPVDRWRVVLKGETPDYISASNVHGYKQQRAFIIAQSPMQSTARDFWKMVYDRKCGVLVMLCDLVETGKETCYQYWPSSGSITVGEFTVDLIQEERLSGFTLRNLSIVNNKYLVVTEDQEFDWTATAAEVADGGADQVPKVPPHNVKVERINGTAMMVSFGRLSLVEARRVNIYYFISYSPSGGARKRQEGGREGPVEGNTTVVTGLDPSTGYDVSVFTATDEQGNNQQTPSDKMTAPRPRTSEPPGGGNAGAIIGGIVTALLVGIIVVAVIIVVLWIKRARDRDRLQLFPKNKRDLYATPSAGSEMVTLRSTSPHESDEARKKEIEASNEVESFSPVPVPQTVVADRLKPISVDSFRDHVNKMHEERDKGFEAEYQSLGSEPLASHEVAKRQHNRVKNRFANIFPYDESRVKLGEIPGEEGSDYINACWMDGYNRSRVYIAAQGPMPNTIADFWRMIWEYKIQHIVILTKCLEAGRRKCEQYWADNIGDVFETQDKKMEITTTSSMPFADFEIRTFNAKNTTEPDEKPLALTQYTSLLADHGVPKFATSLISFIRRVQKAHNKEDGVPLLVHCSAGVGWTVTSVKIQRLSKVIPGKGVTGFRSNSRSARTQGRLRRLMWEFKSKVMVMLCSLSEDGHEACHPFWPYDEGETGGTQTPTVPGTEEGNVGNNDGNNDGEGGNTGVVVAGVLVPIILIVVAAAVLLVVFLVWRKRRGSKDPRYRRSSPPRPPPPSTKKTPPPVASSNALPPPVQYSKSEESVQYRHNSSHRANGKAPVIVDFPDDAQYVQEGEGVMFRVGVTGVPHPKLIWYHNGVEVVPDYSRELAEDGTLSMPSAETNHSGVYQLVAHNPGGRAEREVRLTVAAEGETPPVSGRPPVTLAPVLVTKLADHVEKNHSRGNKGFSDEYQSLYDGEGKTIAIATNSENRLKNRFGNICVYDDHRVILKPLPGHPDCQSDYINASYVGGFSKAGRFLSTQGLSQVTRNSKCSPTAPLSSSSSNQTTMDQPKKDPPYLV